jgi:hypothetical protein
MAKAKTNKKTIKKPTAKKAKSSVKAKTTAKPKVAAKPKASVKLKKTVQKPKVVKKPKDIVAITQSKLRAHLKQLFKKNIQEMDDRFLIVEGSAVVQIVIRPWYDNDSVVDIFSFVVEGATMTPELTNFLLRKNATLHFGAFGLTFDNTVIFSYSLAGSNLDLNELKAALQTVATISDYYDDQIVALAGGRRGIDVNKMVANQ